MLGKLFRGYLIRTFIHLNHLVDEGLEFDASLLSPWQGLTTNFLPPFQARWLYEEATRMLPYSNSLWEEVSDF